ncbi:SGNH/GDSL hydrolase family protein [Psychroserpens damuponensis]|uniref:SGNH/GDSL hydrolase family protein n=1 Tax=Psychroserpens damuponensis TaxID=943936 RepID=UPI000693EBE5|nr:SGNH/GDSL hydrolase family protein [Psychroserpens damuponensis]
MSLRSAISGKLRKLHYLLSTKKVLVLGDSHVVVFGDRQFLISNPMTHFEVCSVGGATVSGLENPNSKTQAYQIFRETVSKKTYDEIIIMMGEVDTGFVVWYRSKKYGEDIDVMLKTAISNYQSLILEMSSYAKVKIISTPLPTLDDDSAGEVAMARKEIEVSQLDRTKLTVEFNRRIDAYCKSEGIVSVNLDQHSLGKDGLVLNKLKNANPLDHHYDSKAHAKLIVDQLKK